jgi:hypothetical protein
MNLFMYLPWPDDSAMVSPAAMFAARIDKLKWKKYSEADLIGPSDLNRVKPDDALYIAGHGAAGNEKIYGSTGQSMTAVELAGQFRGKLNEGHKKIKVWVCFSGDGMTESRGLAYKFWQAMHPKFPQLSVYGYRFAVLDPFQPSQDHLLAAEPKEGFKSFSETPDLLTILPGSAQHWRTGISPSGEIVPPKPLPRGEVPVIADED